MARQTALNVHNLREAVERAGDQPVEITDPQTNTHYILLRADVYRRMREILEEEEDRREKDAWVSLGRKARSDWAKENPYALPAFQGVSQPGIRRDSLHGKHLYEVAGEADIPPQLSAAQGFRVILASQPPETQEEPTKFWHQQDSRCVQWKQA